ncbi:MAG: putative transcriptional regulator involved in heavy-metal (Cu/Zn) homeostasis [Candidatus Parcubacteria bacterium]|jgi:DNA-binding response OmpR family regulator
MRVLLIEDDVDLCNALTECLSGEGIIADMCTEGDTGSYIARTNNYDVLVIDNILPKKNGIDVCKELRMAKVKTPILVMSIHAEIDTKVSYLEAGADDYIAKPFSIAEFVARLKALTRRPYEIADPVIIIDDLTIDTVTQTVARSGKPVYMTRKEFMILEQISKRPGQVVSRADIMDHVWDRNFDPFSNSIETHISNIRKKIDTGKKKRIETIPGRGYRFSTTETGTLHKARKRSKKLLKSTSASK